MSRALRRAALALLIALGGCASLPTELDRPRAAALPATWDARLGRALAPEVAEHPGKRGVLALIGSREAFAARVLLAHSADRSIDVQYYIWHGDTTGELMFEALWDAADRGVRVRLLLDDLNTGGVDGTLAPLASQPQIEVRLFHHIPHRVLRIRTLHSHLSPLP